uniref:Embryonal Fyn-associated substrate n=1 Tax=Sphenodon punctatus TaxID=8508 RepID=A0A8D0HLD3_SPHPU
LSAAPQAQLCRALYDNVAECPDELSFRKGDLMVLLQAEGPALAGWHLCSLHGQQGIVPANRVRVLPEPGSPGLTPRGKESAPSDLYQVPRLTFFNLSQVYEVPPPARPCPLPLEISFKPLCFSLSLCLQVYDVPSSLLWDALSDTYDSPCPFPKKVARVAPQPVAPAPPEDPYDVPPAFKPAPGEEEVEMEEAGPEGPPVYATPSNLRRTSALLNLYESPEEVLGGGAGGHEEEEEEEEGSNGGIYDVPLLVSSSPTLEGTMRGLSLREPGPPARPRLPSAESLSRRPLPALPSSERLAPEPPPPAPSPAITRKGSIQDRPLPPPPPRLGGIGPTEPPEPGGSDAQNEYEGIRLGEEPDYVHLKVSDPQPLTPVPPQLPASTKIPPGLTPLFLPPQQVAPEDAQLLQFYAGQCRTHYTTLLAAAEALLASAGARQPPRLFVPHGKFLIVTAHKLVFVGDTVARLAASGAVRARVGAAGGALCQALREAVLAVKGAALRYPSPPAAELMGEQVRELSRRALAFTTLLTTLAPS